MNKTKDFWTSAHEEFGEWYPNIAAKETMWYPSGYTEITVKLNDGTYIAFDWLNKSISILSNPDYDTTNLTEMEWRDNFSKKLNYKLYHSQTTQVRLSELTGIPQQTISSYMKKRATPSSYNLLKICRALKCSVSELTD